MIIQLLSRGGKQSGSCGLKMPGSVLVPRLSPALLVVQVSLSYKSRAFTSHKEKMPIQDMG